MKSKAARRSQLAKIHIAKKQLGMDDEEYRAMLHSVARVTSAADLDLHGRERVIAHLKRCGARFTRRSYAPGSPGALMAHIWASLGRAGVLEDASDRGLRAWVKRTSATYHPDRVGYDSPDLCPPGVARKLIEHLKRWAKDKGVTWRSRGSK